MRTVIEPFRIKTVEPLRMTAPEERADILARADWNLFKVAADDILIDVLPDLDPRHLNARLQPLDA